MVDRCRTFQRCVACGVNVTQIDITAICSDGPFLDTRPGGCIVDPKGREPYFSPYPLSVSFNLYYMQRLDADTPSWTEP